MSGKNDHKNGGGFFDDLFNKPFWGLVDFNGDGKEDLFEQLMAWQILNNGAKEADADLDNIGIDNELRDFDLSIADEDVFDCDDDDTDDDTYIDADEDDNVDEDDEDNEYDETLEDAENDFFSADFSASTVPGIYDEEINESDFPNKRRYNAASTLANQYIFYGNMEYEREEKDRCRFILENGDKLIAADYLTPDGDFLFSQAVKDNFDLPVTLPDEDETSEFDLSEIVRKIANRDAVLALRVWEWCVDNFLPYVEYAPCYRALMTNGLLDEIYDFPDKFLRALRSSLNEHESFRTKIVLEADELPNCLSQLITDMIRDGYTDAAEAMFDDGLLISNGKWRQINDLMSGLLLFAKEGYEELETMEFVETRFLPMVKSYPDGMIRDEIEGWEKDIADYKQYVERTSEKYAYSRGNAWRNHVPDGSEYGLDPCDYDSEQEYLAALHSEKYAWRERCKESDTLGLDPEQFETEDEFDDAWQKLYDREQQKKLDEQKRQRRLAREKELDTLKASREKHMKEALADKNIYTCCGVLLPFSDRPYSFRTDYGSLKIGDRVIVPVGDNNKETEGVVVSIGLYTRIGLPFPIEKTKFILRKI